MRRSASLVCSVLLASCQAGDVALSSWPDDLRYAAVLLLDTNGTIVSSTGLIDGRAPIRFDEHAETLDRTSRIMVVGYSEETLAEADPPADESILTSRSLKERAPGDAWLPPADRVGFVEAVGGLESAPISIASSTELPIDLTADWLRRCPVDACELDPLGEPAPIDLPGAQGSVYAATAIDSQTALVLTSHGEAYSVTADGATLMTELSTSAPYLAVNRGSDGRVGREQSSATTERGLRRCTRPRA